MFCIALLLCVAAQHYTVKHRVQIANCSFSSSALPVVGLYTLTYQTVGVSVCQQPTRMTNNILLLLLIVVVVDDVIDDVIIIVIVIIDDVTVRPMGVVACVGRRTTVDAECTHTLHLAGTGAAAILSLCDVIEPHAHVTGCDVTLPSVLVTRHVACQTSN